MADELKPCPFCGNDGTGPVQEALHISYCEPDWRGACWSVQCDKCTATMGYSDSEDEARDAWNRRAPADEIAALQARVAELQGALAGAEHDQVDLLFECRKYADAAEADEKKRIRTMRADAIERRLERTRTALKGNPNAHD